MILYKIIAYASFNQVKLELVLELGLGLGLGQINDEPRPKGFII